MKSLLAFVVAVTACSSGTTAPKDGPTTVEVDHPADLATATAKDEAVATSTASSNAKAPPRQKGPAPVDTSALTAAERRDFQQAISETWAPCPGAAVNIDQCMREDRGCAACVPAAHFLFAQVKAGKSKTDREAAFRARFDASTQKDVPIGDAATMGPGDARETIIVWADFECPFCAAFEPVVEAVAKRFPKDVRVAFKVYPLTAHPHGEIAARAAIAAQNQGKYLEMGREMFADQGHLEPADLDRYAKKIGLDLNRFHADTTSQATTDRIARDMKQASSLGLEGTPFVLINGRTFDFGGPGASLEDALAEWVNVDLELARSAP